MTKLRIAAALAATVLLVSACGSDEDAGSNGGAPEDSGTTIEVTAVDFAFEPSSVSLDAGEEVTIRLENSGDAPHTLTAEDLEVDIQTQAGGDSEITITAPEDGTYPFVCSIHPDRMTGEIIVGTGGAGAGDEGTTEGEAENDDGVDY